MKKNIFGLVVIRAFFVLFVVCFFSSCSTRASLSQEVQVIDGCEYIVSLNSCGNIMSHKGNCNNQIHVKTIHDTVYVVKSK